MQIWENREVVFCCPAWPCLGEKVGEKLVFLVGEEAYLSRALCWKRFYLLPQASKFGHGLYHNFILFCKGYDVIICSYAIFSPLY
jgi:hypothetical protein